MANTVIQVLKVSGPISLVDLNARVAGTPEQLLQELTALSIDGLVTIEGPLKELDHAFEQSHLDETAKTMVELSGRGLKSLMSV